MSARRILFLSTLLIGAGLLTRFYYSGNFQSNLTARIQQNVVREFHAIDLEATQLLKDRLSTTSPVWDEAKHFFVRADRNQIVAWNRTYFVPDLNFVSELDTIAFVSSPRGDFLVKKWEAGYESVLYCVVKLTDRFPIVNNFLSSQWEPSIFPIKDVQVMAPWIGTGEEISVNNKVLFKIMALKNDTRDSMLSFILLVSGILLLFVSLWYGASWIGRWYGQDIGILALFLGLLAIRIGMIAIGLPALYWATEIFDPKRFASSSLNASLGDLLLNASALVVLVIYLFREFSRFWFVHRALRFTGLIRFVAGTICLLACLFALVFPFDFIEAIYHNSTLSLDSIQSLSYDSVRIVALASVLLGCFCSFMFFHVFFSLANHLLGNGKVAFFGGVLIAILFFILQFYASGRNLWVNLFLAVLLFSVLKISGINKGVFRISFQLFIYMIFTLGIFSFQNAWAVRTFFMERQVKDQFRFGKDFLTERDVLGEYLLNQARQGIQKDQFIQTRMSSLFLRKTAVVDKIRRVYLNNYFDRYEISIRTHSESQTYPNITVQSPDSVGTVSQDSFLPTGYPGISYKNASEGTAIKRYHLTVPIHYQRPVGWVEVDLALKRVIPENVYPELLVDNRFNQIYRNKDLGYAVFTKGKLVNSFGPFNYERDFQNTWLATRDLFSSGLRDHEYYHIAIEDPEGSVAVVSAATYSWFNFAANFSFWFVIGLFFLFAGQGLMGILSYLRGFPFNYTARIQLFVFLAFLLPALAVSFTTLTLIGRSNEEAIKKDFLERSNTISRRIVGLISPDSVRAGIDTSLETWIEENATSSKTDISVYSPEGKLMATSQPVLFEDNLISRLMDRGAWKKIVLEKESQAVTNEELGKLQYSCAYSAVLSPESGKLMAIVGLPFFESATFLQKSQSLIFSNILIVFVVVFILFSILSFWASSSLTFPIRFITRTLGQTTLNGQNKPLQWNSSDEIGMLVKQYNRMVENLEESKHALAQSEKEMAWREMAKQVAHEIKNPLTPMKLTLQQMELALNSGTLSVEKSQKSLEVLLRQVDILNKIAVSFSTFANMPAPSPQQVGLGGILLSIAELFGATSEGKVILKPLESPVEVLVDPTSFSRALSNIIINALQSGKEGQKDLAVNISVTKTPGAILVEIADNGKGMKPEVQEQVFQPHFTTKQSGSGLGLAMTKQIVMQAGGKIWFDSVLDKGTKFFVELPVINQA